MSCPKLGALPTIGLVGACVVVPPEGLNTDGAQGGTSSDGSTSEGAPSEPVCSEAPEGLIAWWSADEGSTADAIGGAAGLVQGSVTYDDEVPPAVGRGRAFEFADGASSVVIDNRPSLQHAEKDFTVFLWARLDAFEGPRDEAEYEHTDGSLISKMDGPNTQGWRIHFQGGAAAFWFCFGKGYGNGCERGLDTLVEATIDVELHRWYAITGVKDGDVIRLYVDGVPQGTSTMTEYGAADTADIRLGSWVGRAGLEPPGSGFLTGALDEVMLFDRALEEAEIVQLARGPTCALAAED